MIFGLGISRLALLLNYIQVQELAWVSMASSKPPVCRQLPAAPFEGVIVY
jgi:hypothetical protein